MNFEHSYHGRRDLAREPAPATDGAAALRRAPFQTQPGERP